MKTFECRVTAKWLSCRGAQICYSPVWRHFDLPVSAEKVFITIYNKPPKKPKSHVAELSYKTTDDGGGCVRIDNSRLSHWLMPDAWQLFTRATGSQEGVAYMTVDYE